ncbi:hypothetical protein [Tenacibaculum maritimum]|uniref:hypothetical protein n=1 Tax=Tenacibaculum maritimum TaxID=107401 RepID=UPI0012E5BA2F|nr:hypothetical protein [Tenacibaculum maritimum]CAA0209443.1 conserved hypothetical protein [Tenacibaculum maritimum]
MRVEVNKLLKEMLAYLTTRKNLNNDNPLKKAHEYMDSDSGVFYLVAKLINWLDPIILSLPDTNAEKLELRGNEGIDYESSIKEMEAFFQNCPDLEIIFRIENEVIYFNSMLSNKEQVEIRNFVGTNRKRKVTNFYIPVDKNKK